MATHHGLSPPGARAPPPITHAVPRRNAPHHAPRPHHTTRGQRAARAALGPRACAWSPSLPMFPREHTLTVTPNCSMVVGRRARVAKRGLLVAHAHYQCVLCRVVCTARTGPRLPSFLPPSLPRSLASLSPSLPPYLLAPATVLSLIASLVYVRWPRTARVVRPWCVVRRSAARHTKRPMRHGMVCRGNELGGGGGHELVPVWQEGYSRVYMGGGGDSTLKYWYCTTVLHST